MKRLFSLYLVLISGLLSAAVVDAKTVRIATFNIEGTNALTGPGPQGSPDYEATKAALSRINADVVAFQELLGGANESNWRSIADELGYQHVLFGTNSTTMSGNQRLGYFSRFPIASFSTVSSPPGANEMTRLPLRVVISVAGAAKPLVLWNMHHKADDGNATNTPGNQFRRAVEAYRIVQDINAYRVANPSHDEFVMLGDLNDDFSNVAQAEQFTNIPTVTASTYDLGSDIQFPVLYRVFPDERYSSAGGGLHRLDLRQQDGSSRVTRPKSGRTLDYILVSTALRDSPLGSPQGEIYNSQLDSPDTPGLPKAGVPLDAGISLAASDHLPVFADIQMDDAGPSMFVNSFSPGAAAPGVQVTIEGLLLEGATSVRFGGVEAPYFSVVDETQIIATVPEGAWAGPITVSGPNGSASSYDSFLVAALPATAVASTGSSSLTGFTANQGTTSSSQSVAVSAAGLGGPLRISAPPGFEVSTNGTDFFTSVTLSAPARSDAASNYAGSWSNGSTGGNGFGPWGIFASEGSGQAEAYLGDPTNSDVQGMAPTAFALRASPEGSGANIWAWRPLELPLAVGEALAFDWGINWDSNNGSKGFMLVSGSATILSVIQYGYPGQVYLWYGNTFVDTGLVYGTRPMRWTFRQVDARTLNVTATSRGGGTDIAYSANVPVPGAVTGFWCYAAEMDPDPRRISYFDNLNTAPIEPGGGALSVPSIFVRLAANATPGAVSGTLNLSSAGQSLASVAVSGTVAEGAAYSDWARSHELDPQTNGARGADPDKDGYSNWQEFLFGELPTTHTAALWSHERQGSDMLFKFFARADGVAYKLMTTRDLVGEPWAEDFSEVADSADQTGAPPGYRRRHVVVPIVTGARFFRLEAVEAGP
jgi:endonuclease/exonuclease/phosphatase family metal-dependent hydrolase